MERPEDNKLPGSVWSFSPTENWLRYCSLVLLLFIVRGVVVGALTPPLEGWDEYQHIAYIEYLNKHGTPPELRISKVSRDLLKQATKFPQSRSMHEQTHSTGSLKYDEFWKEGPPVYLADHRDISLYQAQHGSLFYRIALPAYRLAGGVRNLPNSVAIVRLLNLLAGSIALSIAMWTLGQLITDRWIAALIVAVVSLQPLYLQNFVRVANDPISILFGTIVIAWSLIPRKKFAPVSTIFSGIALGLAAWAKGTSLALFPFVIISQCIAAAMGIQNWKTAAKDILLVTLIGLTIVAPSMMSSLQKHGTLTPMQEAVHNHEVGNGTLTILQYGLNIDSVDVLRRIWFGHSLIGGGWSFLSADKTTTRLYRTLILLGLFGWVLSFFLGKKTARSDTSNLYPRTLPWQILFLIFSISLALFWHILQSKAAWGVSTTNSWYTSLATPFSMTFVLLGGIQGNRRLGIILAIIFAVIYQWVLIDTIIAQTKFYSNTTGLLSLSRIAELQPWYLGQATVTIAAFLWIVNAFISLFTIWPRHSKFTSIDHRARYGFSFR